MTENPTPTDICIKGEFILTQVFGLQLRHTKKTSPCFLVEWMLGQQQQMSMTEDAVATWWSCLWV